MKKHSAISVYLSHAFKHQLLDAKLDLSAIARRAWGEALDAKRRESTAMAREYGPYVEPAQRRQP